MEGDGGVEGFELRGGSSGLCGVNGMPGTAGGCTGNVPPSAQMGGEGTGGAHVSWEMLFAKEVSGSNVQILKTTATWPWVCVEIQDRKPRPAMNDQGAGAQD